MQRTVYLNAVEYFSFQMFYSFLTCAFNFGTVFAQSNNQSIKPFFTFYPCLRISTVNKRREAASMGTANCPPKNTGFFRRGPQNDGLHSCSLRMTERV